MFLFLLRFRIKGVKTTQLGVTMCNGKVHGRVHVSNIVDDATEVIFTHCGLICCKESVRYTIVLLFLSLIFVPKDLFAFRIKCCV